MAEISKTILESVTFRDELSKINSKVLVGNYGIDETVIQNASGYAGGGATAEEIAVFLINPSIISGDTVEAPTPYSQSSRTCSEFLKLAANNCVLNPLFSNTLHVDIL